MKRLLAYLNQPAPGYEGKPWKTVCIAALLVFFILFLIQPVGTNSIYIYKNYAISPYIALAGYSLVTALCLSLILYGGPVVCKKWYKHWTLGKSIFLTFLIFVFITIGNVLYDYFLFDSSRQANNPNELLPLLIVYIRITLLVGMIPMIMILIYQKNRYLAKNLQQAQELNQHLLNREHRETQIFPSSPVLLSGSTKENITLHPEELLFIEAYGNYVKVHYLREGMIRQKLLRATIKQMAVTMGNIYPSWKEELEKAEQLFQEEDKATILPHWIFRM